MAFNDVVRPQIEEFIGGPLTEGERKLLEASASTGGGGLGHHAQLVAVATAIYSTRRQRTSADIVSSAVDRLEKASANSTQGLTRATWVLAGVAILQAAIMAWGILTAAH